MFRGILGIVIALFSLLALAVIGLASVFLSLPDVRELKGCVTTELYHVHLCDTDPNYTEYAQISPYIIGAVIMSEDASFYSHQGVDFYEMKQSMKTDLNEGRFARGASTITQQLAKNVFLSKKKNIVRKLEEIYLAFQIEKYYTKAKILTLYLNVVEFGDNIYGVKAASRQYFNKAPSELYPEEAAFLAFLLPNPKKYSQSFQKKKLTPFASKTLKTILHKMELGRKITEEEYALAISKIPEFPWSQTAVADENAGKADVGIDSGNPPSEYGPGEEPTDEDNFKFDFSDDDKVEPDPNTTGSQGN